MASEAFEITQQSWVYVDERDLDGFLSIVHEDVEFESVVAEAEGGTFQGHEGVRIWWEQVGESLGTLSYRPTEMWDLGDDAVLTQLVVSGSAGGVEVPMAMWHVVQLRNAKAAWWGSFRTEEEARSGLDAFRQRAQGE
jgi:ketosteroid isomerase-like protein